MLLETDWGKKGNVELDCVDEEMGSGVRIPGTEFQHSTLGKWFYIFKH